MTETAQIQYESQFGQDRFVDQRVFRGMTGGVFVEIGAHDGKTFSNTFALEKSRGWTGLLVEPIPSRFAECQRVRTATCVQGCVGPTSGKQPFTVVEQADMLSGLGGYFSQEHRHRVEHGEGKGGAAVVIQVDCFRFDELMARHGIARVDFCSIDTEGSELEILKTVDFGKVRPTCFSIEHNGNRFAIWRLLSAQGYRVAEALGPDLVFVTREQSERMGAVGLLDRWEIVRRTVKAGKQRLRL